jgi:hypothetical protein
MQTDGVNGQGQRGRIAKMIGVALFIFLFQHEPRL